MYTQYLIISVYIYIYINMMNEATIIKYHPIRLKTGVSSTSEEDRPSKVLDVTGTSQTIDNTVGQFCLSVRTGCGSNSYSSKTLGI